MVLEDICNNYNVIEKDVLSISDTSQELLITLDLLLVFEMKRNAKFQLNGSENKNVIFPQPNVFYT